MPRSIVLSWRAASALILACALAACGGGGSSGGGGFAGAAGSTGTGVQKTETPASTDTAPAASGNSADVRFAP